MAEKKFLAIDLGAESGRGIIGSFNGEKITLKEISRFPTYNIPIFSHRYWDVLSIFSEIKNVLQKAAEEGEIESVGVTTWGVDYALIGKNDLLLSNPFHYRDERTKGIMEEVFAKVPKEEIFQKTGIQFMQINTIFQLYATMKEFPHLLNSAEVLLLMSDLFNFWLSGEKYAEYTNATTSQMYNSLSSGQSKSPRGNWTYGILEKIGISGQCLPEVISPGMSIGNLHKSLREELNLPKIPVVAVCCHDTASAILATPAKGENWAYLSSGTWSLLGVETFDPIIKEKSFQYNFTNEGGYGGSITFLKNIMGLWILQECKRMWEKQGENYSYEQLTELAVTAKPFYSLINVNNEEFFFPGDMPGRIQKYCKDTEQKVPQEISQITRVILESLAMEYRYTIENLEEILGKNLDVIHIVGGGSQNKLLSQFAASSTRKVVVAGPVEATAAGNILTQALSKKEISDVSQLREIIRNSFPLIIYQPKETSLWEEKYQVYKKLKNVK